LKSSREQERSTRIKGWGSLIAVLFGITSLYGLPAAADQGIVLTAASPSTVEPETAASGTVVLRGSRQANPNAGQPVPGRKEYGSTNDWLATPLPGAGWDHNYDTTGFDRNYNTIGVDQNFDRNYDTTGFNRRFDRSGLTR
jgi:hypothetical protein